MRTFQINFSDENHERLVAAARAHYGLPAESTDNQVLRFWLRTMATREVYRYERQQKSRQVQADPDITEIT